LFVYQLIFYLKCFQLMKTYHMTFLRSLIISFESSTTKWSPIRWARIASTSLTWWYIACDFDANLGVAFLGVEHLPMVFFQFCSITRIKRKEFKFSLLESILIRGIFFHVNICENFTHYLFDFQNFFHVWFRWNFHNLVPMKTYHNLVPMEFP